MTLILIIKDLVFEGKNLQNEGQMGSRYILKGFLFLDTMENIMTVFFRHYSKVFLTFYLNSNVIDIYISYIYIFSFKDVDICWTASLVV